MNFTAKSRKAIALLLIAAVVCCILPGCQSGENKIIAETVAETQAPVETVEATPSEPPETGRRVMVKTVDEFLAAIASNTTIVMEPGVYDLTQAADYGGAGNGIYRWEDTQVDGFQLVIQGVENLFITGYAGEVCEIVTAPRYAAVLAFQNCRVITLVNLTVGHSDGPGHCVGAVIRLEDCEKMLIGGCDLYGCGTYGVEAKFSLDVDIQHCKIRDCSQGAVDIDNSENIHLYKSEIFGCGGQDDWEAYFLFDFDRCQNCAVSDCTVSGNTAYFLMNAATCKDIYFVSNQVTENRFVSAVFNVNGAPPKVQNCSFGDLPKDIPCVTSVEFVYADVPPGESGTLEDLKGNPLTAEDLKRMDMEHTEKPFELAKPAEPRPAVPSDGGETVVNVSTVDEFLAAIAPDTTVILAEGTYDLSTASDYGTGWEEYYRWSDVFDGFELEIMNVTNFRIQGAGQGKTVLSAKPRYAEVMMFTDCNNLSIQGITAGHTEEPGVCSGGVLTFLRCNNASIEECGLYGCGIFGITATLCQNFDILNTEIYDCSSGAVWLDACRNFRFDECDIHDCPYPLFCGMGGCSNITMDGEEF